MNKYLRFFLASLFFIMTTCSPTTNIIIETPKANLVSPTETPQPTVTFTLTPEPTITLTPTPLPKPSIMSLIEMQVLYNKCKYAPDTKLMDLYFRNGSSLIEWAQNMASDCYGDLTHKIQMGWNQIGWTEDWESEIILNSINYKATKGDHHILFVKANVKDSENIKVLYDIYPSEKSLIYFPPLFPTPTFTPGGPVAINTPLPELNFPISIENHNVVKLARWGDEPFFDVAFSPNGKYLAVASTRGIDLYSFPTLSKIREISTEDWTSSIAFSPDGDIIASGSWNQIAYLWQVEDGKLLNTFMGNGGPVMDVAFSPDGNTLAVGQLWGSINLWRVANGSFIRTLLSGSSFSDFTFSPDGIYLITDDCGRLLREFKIQEGKQIRTFYGKNGYCGEFSLITFSVDRKIMASWPTYKNIYLELVPDDMLLRSIEKSSGECLLTLKVIPPRGKINFENEPTWTLESSANRSRRQGDEKGGRLRTDTKSISY